MQMISHKSRMSIPAALCVAIILSGCQTIRYYGQAVHGQCRILKNRKPIEQLILDEKISEQLKKKLQLVLDIRKFAIDELSLPANKHYLTYVELDQPYVVWNVFAAPEFSLEPKKWCYPVIGCAVYRGYFFEQDAEDCADRLRKQGYDVYVGGVTAYSTLGWFDDSVLSTFIHRSNTGLASLLFHELAHQVLYVSGDTTFNESFAVTVEQEAIHRWMDAKGNSNAYSDYLLGHERNQQFVHLVLKYRDALEILYAKDLTKSDKRQAKTSFFENLKKDYKQLKEEWGGYAGYDGWFDRDLNNAHLITVSTYHDLVPEFKKLLQSTGNNFERFYTRCKELSKKSKSERRETLMNPDE